MNTKSNSLPTRREFLKTSAVVSGALVAPALLPGGAIAKENRDQLRIGLIGCGGRGSAAAAQTLQADKKSVPVAMADAFEDQLSRSLQGLKTAHSDRAKVTPDTSFVGLDAYQKLIDSGVDVVLLA